MMAPAESNPDLQRWFADRWPCCVARLSRVAGLSCVAGLCRAARRLRSRHARLAAIVLLVLHSLSSLASAAPTQEDVFRSIQTNVGEPASGTGALPFLLAGAAVIILLALFTQRRNRAFAVRPANHQGKLMKEVLKTVPLRSAEVKQLKLLVESGREESGPGSPLTLVLCPTLLAKSIRKAPPKADRRVLGELARKTGAIAEPVAPLVRQAVPPGA